MKALKKDRRADDAYQSEMESHLRKRSTQASLFDIVNDFSKYGRRQEITRFLVRHELFKQILNYKGSIVECGVFSGQGLMSWAQLSAIYEPVAFFRRIFGFDTFQGFPKVAPQDLAGGQRLDWKAGDIKNDSFEDLNECIRLFDQNRFLSDIPKVEIIKGDFLETGKKFIQDNPHVLIALLYLDFDLYEPTKEALQLFLPRMAKGAIIGFDEINNPMWPGETQALLELFKLRDVTIQKFPFEPNMAYLVL